jgi:prolactin regulatory element-binding protein
MISSGTIEGTIIVVGSKGMRTLITVKKAHLGIVTTLAFSQDSRLVSSFYLELMSSETNMQFLNAVGLHHFRTLLSTSFDSTARVTSVGSPKSNGMPHL